MATLANLAVNISANTSAFSQGLQKAQTKTAAFRKSVGGLITTLAGPLAAGAFLVFAKRTLDSMDALAKTADKIGITITKLQELRFVADRAGVSAQALDSSLERFTKRMGEAAQGTGEAVKVFDAFGISLLEMDGSLRDTEDVFADVMKGLASLESPAERAAAAAKVFGREGVAMVNMIKDGIVPFDEMIQRAHDLGIVLDESVFRQAEAAKDAITDMTFVLKAKFTVVVAKALPFIIKSFITLQLAVNGLKLLFFALAWAYGKVITGLANAWEWLKSIMARGMAAIKKSIFFVLIKLMEVLGDVVENMRASMAAMGLPTAAIAALGEKISGMTSSLRRQRNEIAAVAHEAKQYNDILGIQAWALDGLNTAMAENARLRREFSRGIQAPSRGGAGAPAAARARAPGAGAGTAQAGAGAAAQLGEAFPLGGDFLIPPTTLEEGTEAYRQWWLDVRGISLEQQQMFIEESAAFWAIHYAALDLMQREAHLVQIENEELHETTRLERLQQRLQDRVLTEDEHAKRVGELRIESFQEMIATMKDGMQEYFVSLGKGMNGMKAMKNIMIGIAGDTVAGIAEKWGRFYFLEGAVKLAASIFPPNPVQAAAGIAEMAAGGALMALGGAVRASAASAAGGGGGGGASAVGLAATTPFGAAPAGAEGEEGAELPGGGIVVNVHVEGHIVDTQKFIEEVIAPNLAKAVGRGAAFDGQYNLVAERE